MKKALITGANGFIGVGLLRVLEENGAEAIAVVRTKEAAQVLCGQFPSVKTIVCEMERYESLPAMLQDEAIDVCYHLAWAGNVGKERANYQLQIENVLYTLALAQAVVNLRIPKLICAGTITEAVAKVAIEQHYCSEGMVYAHTKHYIHQLLSVFCASNQLQLVWAQLSNTFGIGKPVGNIISYLLTGILQGKELAFTEARQPYDCMYLEDTAYALYLLGVKQNRYSTYFLGSGTPRILKDYLEKAAELVAPGLDIGIGKRPEDSIVYKLEWFDTTELVEDTDFKPAYTFEEGVVKTYQWLKEQP